MVLFWALIISMILHFIFFTSVNSGDSVHEQPHQTFIEISLKTKSAPITAKQNDGVVIESHLPVIELNQERTHSAPSPAQIIKETSVKNAGKINKIPKPQKVEKPIVQKVEIEEKPSLSLESLQQQITNLATTASFNQEQTDNSSLKLVTSEYKQRLIARLKSKITELRSTRTAVFSTLKIIIAINVDGTIASLEISDALNIEDRESAEKLIYASQPFEPLPFELGTSIFKTLVSIHQIEK